MRKLVVIAALALFGTSAHAEVHEMKFGGRIVRIEVPRNCSKPSCVHLSSREIGKVRKAKAAPAIQSEPAVSNVTGTGTVAALPQSARPATPAASATPATQAPAQSAVQSNAEPKVEPKVEPQVEREPDGRKPVARLSLPTNPAVEEPKAAVAATANTVSVNEPKAEAVKPAEPSPLGLWLTEKGEAKVRIEECGKALCGHTENKPDQKILIDMQPTQKNRWNGKVHDARRGATYTSHMSMRNANSLRVEGCAMGGLFCGGETWSRIQ